MWFNNEICLTPNPTNNHLIISAYFNRRKRQWLSDALCVVSTNLEEQFSGITFSSITPGKMMQLPKKLAWAFEIIVSWQRLLFNQRNLTWFEDILRWRKHCYLVTFPPFQIRFSRKTLKGCLLVSAKCARFCSPHILQELLLLKCGGWRIRWC